MGVQPLVVAAFLLVPMAEGSNETSPTEEFTVTITKEQAAECRAGGGCVFVTKRAIKRLAATEFRHGVDYQKQACRLIL